MYRDYLGFYRDYNRDPDIKALKRRGLLIMGLYDPTG